MYEHITKEYILNHRFMGDGLSFESPQISYRLDVNSPIVTSLNLRQTELRKRLSEMTMERYGKNQSKFETECGFSWQLLRKCISGRRAVTREMLAKLCVGMRLTPEEAGELFRLQGHSLEPELNLLDALVVDALQCGDDIIAFYDECKDLGLKVFQEKN